MAQKIKFSRAHGAYSLKREDNGFTLWCQLKLDEAGRRLLGGKESLSAPSGILRMSGRPPIVVEAAGLLQKKQLM
jgi:hypothetical protein